MPRIDSSEYPLISTTPKPASIIPIVEDGKQSRVTVAGLAMAASDPQPLIDAAIAAHEAAADPHAQYATDVALAAVSATVATKENVISAGTTSQYWRGDKSWRDFATDVRAAVLTGLSLASAAAVTASDSVLAAIGKLQAQFDAKADKKLAIRVVTSSGNAVAGDAGNMISTNIATPNTLTIPSGTFTAGDQIIVEQINSGQTTLVAGSGVTLNSRIGLKLSGQYALATLICKGGEVFSVGGDLTT